MISEGPAAADALAQALAEVRRRLGEPPFADRRRVVSLLADRLPDAKRELRAVAAAIDEGVPAALAGVERHLVGLEMDRLAARLESSIGLRIEIARPIVRAFAFALDLGPLPSVYADAAALAPATPPAVPASDGWAGMTQPVHRSLPMPPPHPSQPVAPPPAGEEMIRIGSITLPRKQAIGSGIAAALALGVVGYLELRPATSAGPAERAVEEARQRPAVEPKGIGGEETDFGVAAKEALESNVGSPTPLEVPGGRRVTTPQVQEALRNPRAMLIDVLANNHPQTIKGARFVPVGGLPGTVNDSYQTQFVAALEKLTGGDRSRPLILFCAGPECWESYNAVLRARAAGYRELLWYRGGLVAWAAAGQAMEATPAPAS